MSDPGQSALVLIGHGSARFPDAGRPILDLAASLRRTGRYAEVAVTFIKSQPGPERIFELVQAETIVLVPVFAGKGWYTDTLIPLLLGLTGPVTRRDDRTIITTPPVGAHVRLPGILANRGRAVAKAAGLVEKAVSLLLIAHGSTRPGGAGETPRAIADAIRALQIFRDVRLVFLEQEPRVAEWPDLVEGDEVIVLPLLVAQGAHAIEDIAPLFGLAAGQSGPIETAGHRVRLAGCLGAEPELADIIAEMAESALTGV
jgi:sirohydrochlorin cobaltochelatase